MSSLADIMRVDHLQHLLLLFIWHQWVCFRVENMSCGGTGESLNSVLEIIFLLNRACWGLYGSLETWKGRESHGKSLWVIESHWKWFSLRKKFLQKHFLSKYEKKKNKKKKTERKQETDFHSVEVKTAHFDTVKWERFVALWHNLLANMTYSVLKSSAIRYGTVSKFPDIFNFYLK